MLAAYLLGEKSIGLKALAFNKLGIEMTPIADVIGKGTKQISMSEAAIEEVADYACADADTFGDADTYPNCFTDATPPHAHPYTCRR